MKQYGKSKTVKTENKAGKISKKKKSGAFRDISIAARLFMLGLLIASANALFNFIYFGGQKKIKITYPVKCFNRFINSCALTFNRLESGLSFRQEI